MHTHHWYSIGWSGWFGVIGVGLTVIGLVVAVVQLTRTKGAIEAAAEAVRSAEDEIAVRQLLFLVPQLRHIAAELDSGIDGDDRTSTQRSLESWRFLASHVKGVLGDGDRDIARKVTASVAQAATAGDILLRGDASVFDSCQKARAAIGQACAILVTALAVLSTKSRS